MLKEKKRTRKIREETHSRDGSLSVSDLARALDRFSAYHGRSENDATTRAY